MNILLLETREIDCHRHLVVGRVHLCYRLDGSLGRCFFGLCYRLRLLCRGFGSAGIVEDDLEPVGKRPVLISLLFEPLFHEAFHQLVELLEDVCWAVTHVHHVVFCPCRWGHPAPGEGAPHGCRALPSERHRRLRQRAFDPGLQLLGEALDLAEVFLPRVDPIFQGLREVLDFLLDLPRLPHPGTVDGRDGVLERRPLLLVVEDLPGVAFVLFEPVDIERASHAGEGVLEVLSGDPHVADRLLPFVLALFAHRRDELAHGGDLCFTDQRLDVGADVTLGPVDQFVDVDVVCEDLPVPEVHLEDLLSALPVGRRDVDDPVQPAGAEQRLVQHVRAVGSAENHDIVQFLEAVELCQDLAYHTFSYVR